LPALIISRSLRNNQACIVLAEGSDNKDSLIIDQMYYGIPSSITHPDLVYRLNAIFNSRMAFYMAFMFSSGLGWDRRLIEVGDWQQIRLPGTILANASMLWTEVLQLEHWLRENWQSALEASLAHEISAKENELNQTIFQLYDLSVSRVAGLEEVLSMLSATLRIEVADHLSLRRNLRIYDGKSFWVIKPSEKRLWSETAALSDADTIVREHMEVSKSGNG